MKIQFWTLLFLPVMVQSFSSRLPCRRFSMKAHSQRSPSPVRKTDHLATTIWKFSRPHTLIGTAISIPSIYVYAAPPGVSVFNLRVLRSILYAILCSGLINIFITGLNQITDVDIDRVSKPMLPIPSGELSVRKAVVIILSSLVVGMTLAVLSGSSYLMHTVLGSVVLGVLYSMPPFRLKRNPFLAALCIITTRGLLINGGFYGHAIHCLYGQTLNIFHDLKCLALISYFSIFGAVISIFKDIPDIHGDQLYGIRSFSVRVGAKRMFKISIEMIQCLLKTTAFGIIITIPFYYNMVQRMLIAWWCMFLSVNISSKEVDPTNTAQVYTFYMFLWQIFYQSYFMLPFLR